MIKKYILGLLVFLGFGLGFSNAFVFRPNNTWGYSILDNSINLNVFNKGQLGSDRFGLTKRMLAFESKERVNGLGDVVGYDKIFFFRGPDNHKPYYLVSFVSSRFQGYLKTYYLCDEILSTSSISGGLSYMNCTVHSVTDNFVNEVGPLLQSMTIDDYWGYFIETWSCYGSSVITNQVCFSSSEYHKSLCFSAGGPKYDGCGCTDCNNLRNSLGISYSGDFSSIQDGYLNTPPGFVESSSGLGTNTGSTVNNSQNDVLTGSIVYNTCTNRDVLLSLNKLGFSVDLCAGGYDNWDLYTLTGSFDGQPGVGKWLDDIYSYTATTGQDYNSWFNYWNNVYLNQYVANQNLWLSQPAVLRGWFYYYNSYNGPVLGFENVWNYCSLLKNTTLNDLEDLDYTGSYYSWVCGNNSSIYDNDIVDIGDGKVAIGVNWDGIGGTGGKKVYSNSILFIQDMFDRLRSSVKTDFGFGTGILPTYIIVFFCAVILFKFLRK